jgi:hypothetical protein
VLNVAAILNRVKEPLRLHLGQELRKLLLRLGPPMSIVLKWGVPALAMSGGAPAADRINAKSRYVRTTHPAKAFVF